MENFDLNDVLNSIDKVKEVKNATENKPSKSKRLLSFEVSKDDTPLKALIINKINEKKFTYSDIIEYCVNISGGERKAGATLAYNIIGGLRRRSTMSDVTFHLLCDFLNLDIILRDRDTGDEVNNTEEGKN